MAGPGSVLALDAGQMYLIRLFSSPWIARNAGLHRQAWALLDRGSFAFPFQGLRHDQDCQADFGAKLPQTMGGVPNGLPFVGFIDARTVDEFSP